MLTHGWLTLIKSARADSKDSTPVSALVGSG